MMSAGASDDFWDNEAKWQQSVHDAAFNVTIGDHRTEGSRFKSFVTYNVLSPLATDGVRRRYSDFEWLREILKNRFHGVAIPTLPEKRVMNQGAEFLEERKQGLASFMLNLVKSPYLQHDFTVRAFLSVRESGAGEWEQAKRAAASGEGAHPSVNEGLNRWFGVLRHFSIPSDADEACTALSVHLDEMEKSVGAVLAAVSKYHACAAALATSVTALSAALEGLETTAMMGSTSLPATLSEAAEFVGAYAAVSNKVGTAVRSLADLSTFSPSEIQVFLMDAMIKEIQRVRSLKELLSIRESALKDYQSAWGKQDKLEYEQKQWVSKGRQDRSEKLEPQIAAASQIVKQCRERLDDITKGVVHVEAAKLGRARLEKYTAIYGQYAALGIASGAKVQELWSTFLGSMELVEADMVTAAQTTLSSQSADDATNVTILVGAGRGGAPVAPAPSFAGAGAGAGAAITPPAVVAAAQEVDL